MAPNVGMALFSFKPSAVSENLKGVFKFDSFESLFLRREYHRHTHYLEYASSKLGKYKSGLGNLRSSHLWVMRILTKGQTKGFLVGYLTKTFCWVLYRKWHPTSVMYGSTSSI